MESAMHTANASDESIRMPASPCALCTVSLSLSLP
jgi:hypothetical protein